MAASKEYPIDLIAPMRNSALGILDLYLAIVCNHKIIES
jgi:hypothetical protein